MEKGHDDDTGDRKGRMIQGKKKDEKKKKKKKVPAQSLAQGSIMGYLVPLDVVPRKRSRERPSGGEGFEIRVKGEGPTKKFRTTGLEQNRFLGEVPIEIVDSVMRMMGLKDVIRMQGMSTSFRDLLVHIMGRGHARPYDMRLRIDVGSSEGCSLILDGEDTIATDGSNLLTIDGVMVEDAPFKPRALRNAIPWLPGLMVENRYYEIKGYGLSREELIMDVDPFYNDLVSMSLQPMTKREFNGPYGTSRVSEPLSINELNKRIRERQQSSATHLDVDVLSRIERRTKGWRNQVFTAIKYKSMRDRTMHIRTLQLDVHHLSVLNERGYMIMGYRESLVSRMTTVALMGPGWDTVWEVDIGEMMMECACEIVNGMILFSVVHPDTMRRTIFVIERGPKVRKAVHLDTEGDRRVIKMMAYHKGVAVAVTGPDRSKREYDEIIAMDMMHGNRKSWKINPSAMWCEYDTQGKGLRFQLKNNNLQVIAL